MWINHRCDSFRVFRILFKVYRSECSSPSLFVLFALLFFNFSSFGCSSSSFPFLSFFLLFFNSLTFSLSFLLSSSSLSSSKFSSFSSSSWSSSMICCLNWLNLFRYSFCQFFLASRLKQWQYAKPLVVTQTPFRGENRRRSFSRLFGF